MLRQEHEGEIRGMGTVATAAAGRDAPLRRIPGSLDGPAGSALTLMAQITGDHLELTQYLEDAGKRINKHPDFPLSSLTRVHFMRWVVLELRGSHWLAFESNHDGLAEEHLGELVGVCEAGIRKIYAFCVGSPCAGGNPCTTQALVAYLLKRRVPYNAFHVANHGYTFARIKVENDLRAAVQDYLDADPDRLKQPPRRLFDAIEKTVDPALLAALRSCPAPQPVSQSVLRAAAGPALIALALWPITIPAAALYLLWLRRQEPRDAEETRTPAKHALAILASREDVRVQNQLTHVVRMKPGRLRRWTLQVVLWAVNRLARRTYTQGSLGDMSTIHFARWLLVDNGHYLLFFSNYDGSWESYLSDFIDKASKGLTGVWSNTERFPRTTFLLWDGSRREERFKVWTRLHQVETQFWYSAYDELSIGNIRRNAKICAGLVSGVADDELDGWLALL